MLAHSKNLLALCPEIGDDSIYPRANPHVSPHMDRADHSGVVRSAAWEVSPRQPEGNHPQALYTVADRPPRHGEGRELDVEGIEGVVEPLRSDDRGHIGAYVLRGRTVSVGMVRVYLGESPVGQ